MILHALPFSKGFEFELLLKCELFHDSEKIVVAIIFAANGTIIQRTITRQPTYRRERIASLLNTVVKNAATNVISSFAYTYDYLSRITTRTEGTNTNANAYNHRSEVTAANNQTNAYDHAGRRITKWTPSATTTYIYDGWNMVAEIKQSSVSTTNHYVWGKDLSGTMQGAGGVGGLVSVSLDGTLYFPLADSNGNITEYVDANGAVVAQYRYDAFGTAI